MTVWPLSKIMEGLDDEERRTFFRSLTPGEAQAALDDWPSWAHPGQLPPGAHDWRTWVIMGGRGFGKTRAGSQFIADAMRRDQALRIALVGATIDEARRVMVEGVSGLLNVAAPWIARWTPSQRTLRFTNGSEATLFSGASPEALRGPEHHLAWCDELAMWERPQDSWDMLQLGLRLGTSPRAIVTTTPRSVAVLDAIMARPTTLVTGGATAANPHLPPAFIDAVTDLYAGTHLGAQELEGRMLPPAGALWTRAMIEACRIQVDEHMVPSVRPERSAAKSKGVGANALRLRSGRTSDGDTLPIPPCRNAVGRGTAEQRSGVEGLESVRVEPVDDACEVALDELRQDTLAAQETSLDHARDERGGVPFLKQTWPTFTPYIPPRFTQVVIGVDPPAGGGTCGIVVCARDAAGQGHVLADHSVTGASPEGWARAVAAAAAPWPDALVVAEANQGGRMVRTVLDTAGHEFRLKLVTAHKGKAARAEPIALLFEQGRVSLHGTFPQLEAELLGFVAGEDYAGPGGSPDRADAMVWALGELMAGPRRTPRVVQL